MNIFDSTDYRVFLSAHVRSQPRQGWGYLGQLARIVGISPTQMSQVLGGKKDLTLEQAHRFCIGVSLGSDETEYFMNLIGKARAGTVELRKFHQAKLNLLREKALDLKHAVPNTHELSEEQRSIFYSDWRYSAIRLFSSIEPSPSISEIQKAFDLPNERFLFMIEFLVSAGLCVREGGRLKMGAQRTFVGPGSAPFFQHQVNWRLKSLERAKDSTSKEELFFTSPVSLSYDDFRELSARLREMIKEFSDRVRVSPAEHVACLNLDFFKIFSD